ncbi:ETS-related transcription factor Elf-2 [Liparis tanakae]|uniref:ETS-related transcription factor Elf-2 n=1 Tax=Liparis tanakae TaxID=230148 RepID=A0A4Z2G0P6_9TELE|nr:ETS-related transcription factor Elf-2 [Liparis tanakae]
MVPATAENGDKITVQLAKIITIPAHQLAQCHLQTAAGANKFGSPSGLSLLRSPLTVRALAPVNVVAPGTQVMRLTLPTQAQQQTLVVTQAGGGGGVVTVSTAHPRILSGVINGSELVIGGAAVEKLKAAGVQVQAVQLAVRQQGATAVQSGALDAEVVIKLEAPDVKIEPEC